MRQQIFEDRLLDGFPFRGCFDHQIGAANISQLQGCADPACGGVFFVFGNQPTTHLTGHVLFNLGRSTIQRLLRHVAENDIITGKRHHMRNPVAHLPGANHAN